MGGKAALLLIIGFSSILLVVGNNFVSLTNRSIDNFNGYYINTQAYNIAVSGANMAANQIFMDRTWSEGYSNVSFSNGTLNVIVSNNTLASGAISKAGKTTICHRGTTITIGNAAVPAHLAHGDVVGSCGGAGAVDDELAIIISEGTFMGTTKTVIVTLRPSGFQKFGNFYASLSALPATGDTFHGPFHVNSSLRTYGTPVFFGKTTYRTTLTKTGTPAAPVFLGGSKGGIDIPLEFDTTKIKSTADVVFTNSTTKTKGVDVQLYFNADGTVTYAKRNEGSAVWTAPVTTALTTLAPNGVIYGDKANLFVKGTLDGSVTIVANKNGRTNYGNIYQVDDIKYNSDPATNPNSDDMLGMIATESIKIEDNADTRGQSVITQASMFAMNGTIGPVDALITQPYLGDWKIYGGLIAKSLQATATYDASSNPIRGLRFNHRYDTRFLTQAPPSFPKTKNFEVVSWYE